MWVLVLLLFEMEMLYLTDLWPPFFYVTSPSSRLWCVSAPREANVDSKHVSCLQHTSNGQVVLTFRRVECKEQFLHKSVLKVGSTTYTLQDVDWPLTYLEVYDAPHELPDLAIIHRLSQYCGHFTQPGWEHVHDCVRHYCVCIKLPFPSFLRFDRYYVQFRYVGQPCLYRQTNHLASACHTITCFNCEKTGHLGIDCLCPLYCNICKSPAHGARSCPFSWSRLVYFSVSTSETTSSNTESTTSDNSTNDQVLIFLLKIHLILLTFLLLFWTMCLLINLRTNLRKLSPWMMILQHLSRIQPRINTPVIPLFRTSPAHLRKTPWNCLLSRKHHLTLLGMAANLGKF